MNEIKQVIAKNITQLRLAKGMTQLELATELNYSDKAVSKWERGESIPDISVLMHIADIFSVTLDYLVHPHKTADKRGMHLKDKNKKKNHAFITGMSILLVWLIALLAFVVLDILPVETSYLHTLAFVYAVPVSMVVWLTFNAVWFNKRRNYIIISLIMWSSLASIHISFLPFGYNFWLIYLLAVPGQIIILLWSGLRFPKENKMLSHLKRKKNSQIQ